MEVRMVKDMQIEFSGAAGCVTGSSHLLKVKDKRILMDCGLFQGRDEERGNDSFPFIPATIDYLVLSHAHIDHSGRIPLLYKRGFRGRIIATPPTIDLCNIMLLDSGFIQEQEAQWENKKLERQGKDLKEPLYTVQDATDVLPLFEPLEFDTELELFDGFRIKFQVAGHILGAAIVEVFMKEEEKEVKLVYSGDLGNHGIPLMKDPTVIESCDYLIMESTYGNRLHPDSKNEFRQLVEIINATYKRGGNVIIPSFAVGRTQEILYILNEFMEAGELNRAIKVYVDSPLATKSTEVFRKNRRYFDEEAQEKYRRGDNVLEFPNLYFTESVEDSMELNHTKKGCVIISASGMADAGRVKHHLKYNLWRPESAVVFVGYQAEGTLGRRIQDGEKMVRIFQEDVAVHASVHSFSGLSGHADRNGLYEWLKGFKKVPLQTFLVHGDQKAASALKELFVQDGYNVKVARDGDIVPLQHYVKLPAFTDIEMEKTEIEAGISALRKKEAVIKYLSALDFAEVSDLEILKELEHVLVKHTHT